MRINIFACITRDGRHRLSIDVSPRRRRRRLFSCGRVSVCLYRRPCHIHSEPPRPAHRAPQLTSRPGRCLHSCRTGEPPFPPPTPAGGRRLPRDPLPYARRRPASRPEPTRPYTRIYICECVYKSYRPQPAREECTRAGRACARRVLLITGRPADSQCHGHRQPPREYSARGPRNSVAHTHALRFRLECWHVYTYTNTHTHARRESIQPEVPPPANAPVHGVDDPSDRLQCQPPPLVPSLG